MNVTHTFIVQPNLVIHSAIENCMNWHSVTKQTFLKLYFWICHHDVTKFSKSPGRIGPASEIGQICEPWNLHFFLHSKCLLWECPAFWSYSICFMNLCMDVSIIYGWKMICEPIRGLKLAALVYIFNNRRAHWKTNMSLVFFFPQRLKIKYEYSKR